jgi:TolA-binding protein
MTFINQLLHPKLIITMTAFLLLSSCAYFNTFYNAQYYFKLAEKQRLEKAGESIPPSAIDAYGKVIDKSQYVLDKYPDSKYCPEALFLIGKSRFHRKEYRIAENMFKQYTEKYANRELEAEYWQALCKWKLGKPQPALDDLNSILNKTNDTNLRSKIYLSTAEIQLEGNNPKSALEQLELAASSNRDRDERGQIYYRLADLAYNAEDFERSLKAYKQVIKNTTSKKRKEEANLMIVRIHRQLGNWGKVQNIIKNMLLDDVFKTIHGDLELELVKLYQMDGRLDEAITRLESIKEDYKNTKISAEANYIHGEIELYDRWILDDAAKYFGQVTREYRQSPFTQSANLRKKEITEYQESVAEISRLDEFIIQMYAELDTIKIDSIRNIIQSEILPAKKSLTENIYNLGELEAFHFKRSDSSMVHFQRIIDEFADSEIYPKALFVMYYLNDQKGDETKAQIYSERILAELPVSEYADFLRKSMDLPDDPNSIQALLRQAELEWLINPENALIYYKNILKKDSLSETSARAALFLAYHYDYTFFNQDSALKYYTWLQDYHDNSEQANASRDRYEFLINLSVDTIQDSLDN